MRTLQPIRRRLLPTATLLAVLVAGALAAEARARPDAHAARPVPDATRAARSAPAAASSGSEDFDHSGHRLDTAIFIEPFDGPELDLAVRRTREAGATGIRLGVRWREIAPTRPGNAADPDDPAYRWHPLDARVARAVAYGLRPILTLWEAPDWAQGTGNGLPGTVRPDPRAFGAFAAAAAARYSGRHEGLPRVRHWEAWNEPNLHIFLSPQFEDRRPVSPPWYRRLLEEFARGVRSVHRDNVVIAGGTAPFQDIGVRDVRWGPLTFMRALLCLDEDLERTCRTSLDFDVWSHHPYTEGPPAWGAVRTDDVSLADLPELRRVLDAAARAGQLRVRDPRLWVTEFSWDSNPPDPGGVPAELHPRWVAEALYTAWGAGVTLFTWFKLCDDPMPASVYQSGLYPFATCFERPKPALAAFRFPLVAYVEDSHVRIWGRLPHGRPGRVLVQQSLPGRWRRVGLFRTDRDGIFDLRLRLPRTGSIRAWSVETGAGTVPFALAVPKDLYVRPFGVDS